MKTSLCETLCDSIDRLTAAVARYELARREPASPMRIAIQFAAYDAMRKEATAAKAVSDAARAILAQAAAALPHTHLKPANDLHPSPPSAA